MLNSIKKKLSRLIINIIKNPKISDLAIVYVKEAIFHLVKHLIASNLSKTELKDVITYLVPKDTPVIMNITVTSDILEYNNVHSKDSILHNNKVKSVSDRQSFVYNPSNTTYVS